MFVVEGQQQQIPVNAMPGVNRYSIDRLLNEAKLAFDLGIPAIALFPQIDSSLRNRREMKHLILIT